MGSIIDLNSGEYSFKYERTHTPLENGKELENIIVQIANNLKGAGYFVRGQYAALVVIGYDMDNVPYVLNDPAEWALDKYKKENSCIRVRKERIGNDEIARISVCNMLAEGKDSEILIADVSGATSTNGYGYLEPIYLKCNTRELGSLMTELMNLHLLRIRYSKSLSWLLQRYSH